MDNQQSNNLPKNNNLSNFLGVTKFASKLKVVTQETNLIKEEFNFTSGQDLLTRLEIITKRANSNIQKIQERVVQRKNLSNTKEFLENQTILAKLTQMLSADFINSLQANELKAEQVAEIEGILLVKKSEIESLRNKISSQLNDIEAMANFLQISNPNTIASPISNLNTPVAENYQGKELITATLERMIDQARTVIQNPTHNDLFRKKVAKGLQLINRAILNPNQTIIVQLVSDLKQLDTNQIVYWKVRVIPLETYLNKWEKLTQYQNQPILTSYHNWQQLPAEVKAEKQQAIKNNTLAKINASVPPLQTIKEETFEGEKTMETNNNTEINNEVKTSERLKDSDVFNQEFKDMKALHKVNYLKSFVEKYIKEINSLNAKIENLETVNKDLETNVQDLSNSLEEQTKNSKLLIEETKANVRKEFAGLVELSEILKLNASDKDKVINTLEKNDAEEGGFDDLIDVIKMRDQEIEEKKAENEQLIIATENLNKKITNLEIAKKNEAVFVRKNFGTMMLDLESAETHIQALERGDKFTLPYERFSERVNKSEKIGEEKTAEVAKADHDEESETELSDEEVTEKDDQLEAQILQLEEGI